MFFFTPPNYFICFLLLDIKNITPFSLHDLEIDFAKTICAVDVKNVKISGQID